MKKAVLVVTHRRGFEADLVIDRLREWGMPVFRFNCDSGKEISRVALSIGLGNVDTILFCDGRKFNGAEIGAGWCQQLPPYLGQPADTRECLQRRNLFAAQASTFEFLEIPWLNSFSAVLRASNKIIQLAKAQAIGLRIPYTLIANLPESIITFASKQPTIAKNLATPWVVTEGITHAAHTKLIQGEWLTKEEGLAFSPVIYQPYHERRRDYRVVVIDHQFFAVSCEPDNHQREDIRRGSTGESFKICKFDSAEFKKLRKLMTELDVNYCAADFMEDMKGQLYFLELNVCGAWWWVDKLYDGAICHAIADYLRKTCL